MSKINRVPLEERQRRIALMKVVPNWWDVWGKFEAKCFCGASAVWRGLTHFRDPKDYGDAAYPIACNDHVSSIEGDVGAIE